MKQMVIAMLLLLPTLAFGQTMPGNGDDTSAAVVDRYLQLMNLESYSADSMLVMETAVTTYGSDDTLWLYRWFSPSRKHRIEVWYHGILQNGLISNSEDVFLQYNTAEKKWEEVEEQVFLSLVSGYDFRGPLYLWRWNGSMLSWNGTTDLDGHPMQVVKVSRAGMYDRFYMFDPGSGLLTLIVETEEHSANFVPMKESHIEWKSIHEYLPVGVHLVPSLESFKRDGKLTILSTTAHMEYIRPRIFNRE
jgi:hypothetical protein